jgi:cyanophycinase
MRLLRIAPLVIGIAALLPSACFAEPKGSLVIGGGAIRFDDLRVWSKIVELAGGPGAKIAIFPTASGNPRATGKRLIETFRKAGADAFVVPVAVKNIDVDYREAVNDPKLIEQVRKAGGVYFTGGEQDRILKALRTPDGQNTPLLEAVWDVYRRGGVVAGSSAGAAVMSRVMYRDAEFVLPTLQRGVTMGKEIAPGLGFIGPSWFVEQHCLTRGRFARALVVMHSQGFKYGIGVDENTALVIHGGRELEVIGYRGAIVLDMSQTTSDPQVKAFNLKNVRISYLDRGDSVDLETLAITPSPEKEDGQKIDPNGPDFKPLHDRVLFSNDILGNTTLIDLLTKLINNKQSEAIGLAFDGLFAKTHAAQGFEFRFYREADSVGWVTEAFGGEDFTVSNIHLDVQPIDVVASFYKPAPALPDQLATVRTGSTADGGAATPAKTVAK